jgi:hypothetical protein
MKYPPVIAALSDRDGPYGPLAHLTPTETDLLHACGVAFSTSVQGTTIKAMEMFAPPFSGAVCLIPVDQLATLLRGGKL